MPKQIHRFSQSSNKIYNLYEYIYLCAYIRIYLYMYIYIYILLLYHMNQTRERASKFNNWQLKLEAICVADSRGGIDKFI